MVPHQLVLKGDSGLCFEELFLVVLVEPYGMPGIETGLPTGKGKRPTHCTTALALVLNEF